MKAIQIERFGGPEVIALANLPEPSVGAGQELLHVDHAGVNFSDIHLIENSYLERAKLPFVPGTEVVGHTQDGRRLACMLPIGGYAQRVACYQHMSFEVPEGVSDGQALALMVQGITAWHLLSTSARLEPGESVVVHAASGGVGSIAIQLAKKWGARVIATGSTPEKRQLAEELGADAAVDSAAKGLIPRMRQANAGKPVDIVLEMVGGTVFDVSYAVLAPFGRLITYGMASGTAPQPLTAQSLMRQSRTVAGFYLRHVLEDPPAVAKTVSELFAMAASGELRTLLGGEYPLSQTAAAHTELKSRRVTGKLILDPAR